VVEFEITLMVILEPGRVYESLARLCGTMNKVKVTTYAGHALLFCKIVLALPTLPGWLQFVPNMAGATVFAIIGQHVVAHPVCQGHTPRFPDARIGKIIGQSLVQIAGARGDMAPRLFEKPFW
jgi:hypothetical protein